MTKAKNLQPISKEDFPIFETLSAKKLTEEKITQREVKNKTLFELVQKKKRAAQSAYWILVSLILGIGASLFAVFIQQKGINESSIQPIICCDSLDSKYLNLQKELDTLKKQISIITISKSYIKTDSLIINSNVSLLEKRIKIIETGISDNPEKTLSILQIRQEIELLKKANDYSKELIQAKLDGVKDKMELQNAWMIGVTIAIFGTILSLAIPNLLTRRNRNNTEN